MVLGLVFDQRVVSAGEAPLGAGIYELQGGRLLAVVSVSARADLSWTIARALGALAAAGASLSDVQLTDAETVRTRLRAKVVLSPEILRRQILAAASPSSSPTLPRDFVSTEPRSKLDVLSESIGVDLGSSSDMPGLPSPAGKPARAAAIHADPVPRPSRPDTCSVTVHRQTGAAKLHRRTGSKSEFLRDPCRHLYGEKVGRGRRIRGAVTLSALGTRRHLQDLSYPAVGPHEEKVEREPGVLHPERGSGRRLLRKEEDHPVVGSYLLPPRKTCLPGLGGGGHFEAQVRVASVQHRRIGRRGLAPWLRLQRGRYTSSYCQHEQAAHHQSESYDLPTAGLGRLRGMADWRGPVI